MIKDYCEQMVSQAVLVGWHCKLRATLQVNLQDIHVITITSLGFAKKMVCKLNLL